MKKLKLTLNKETIAKLEDEKMDAVKGGTSFPSCTLTVTGEHKKCVTACGCPLTVMYTDCGPEGIHNCAI